MAEQNESTASGGAIASNPGRLRPSYWRYGLCFPAWPTIWLGGLIAMLLLSIMTHWLFVFGLVPLLAVNICYWTIVRSSFQKGCVNPAVVVSRDRNLIAVWTDLTTGQGSHPVIKVLPHPLFMLPDGMPEVGTRLATIAIYRGEAGASHWEDFLPKAVGCVTRNPQEIDRILRSIPAREWKELERGLQQVPRPFKPGLNFVDPPSETAF